MKKISFLYFSFFFFLMVVAGHSFAGENPNGNSSATPSSTASEKKDAATAALDVAGSPSADTSPYGDSGFDPTLAGAPGAGKETSLPGGHIKMSGHYRLAAGDNGDDFIVNQANANQNLNSLQGPNYRYIYGERLNNTYDPAIYSQYLLNVDFSPVDKINFHTQIVNDPWSWVGTTGEQVQGSDIDPSLLLRYNLKYIGAFNSTVGEVYRSDVTDRINFPEIKIHGGHTTPTVVHGFEGYSPATGGLPYTIPELDIDFEYRPIRKLWVDYTEDQWHARFFALADQEQALTTDDPLMLSNHKDYWQESPWLYQYCPIQYMTGLDGLSVKRGYYSDSLSFLATDSEGNRLVLLRGVAVEGNLDKTTIAATVAAPFTPWDEKYFSPDNIPGAIRIKHQFSDEWMLGGTYTFRSGLIDNHVADFGQVGGMDVKYQINPNTALTAEMAASRRELDLLESEAIGTNTGGYAYKAALASSFDHGQDGHTDLGLSFTQMNDHFEPLLSRYLDTRDDSFWGNHISFIDCPTLEPFRLGDGVDVNRIVVRANWKEKLFNKRFENLIDIRNVHRASNTAYMETVSREEATYHFNSQLTGKALFRWRALPRTTQGIEPTLTDYYFPKDDLNLADFTIRNDAVKADQNADQFTYSLGLQYIFSKQWTAEGIAERTNAIPDFPRGLLLDFYKDANERIDGILTDRVRAILYGQDALKAAPPYPYFNIFKERLIYQPEKRVTCTLHATENSYKATGGLDDNISHVGLSVAFDFTKKLSFFTDYTYSRQLDVPNLISTNYEELRYGGHHNIYFSMDYKINPATIFRTEYGVFDMGASGNKSNPYSNTTFSLPTIDTEHLLRMSLTGDF